MGIKHRSEFKHLFTNSACFHCAILKALHNSREKTANKSGDIQFYLQNFQNEIFQIFKMFKTT